ncbi:MAG TPA: hypothetical protein PK622_08825, partial [Saprospiraceae bacterium]|nr:hypothetical protein [Saprospiraceae bacterium]
FASVVPIESVDPKILMMSLLSIVNFFSLFNSFSFSSNSLFGKNTLNFVFSALCSGKSATSYLQKKLTL